MPGSKPGERRGGRQKGTPNKVTAELRGAAQSHNTPFRLSSRPVRHSSPINVVRLTRGASQNPVKSDKRQLVEVLPLSSHWGGCRLPCYRTCSAD